MSLYHPKPKQLKLLHSYGRPKEPSPVQPIHPTHQRPETPEDAARLMEEAITAILIHPKHNDEVMGKIPAEVVRLLGDCAQYNRFNKATTYRHYSQCDHQNLSCYVVTAKALGFTAHQITQYWLHNIGKGNGGASFPFNGCVLNLRTVRGDNSRYRFYPNRQHHQIQAFLFAQYEEQSDGGAYVSTNGWCERWQVSQVPKKQDSKGKDFFQLNTRLLASQGSLRPFTELVALVEG